jgi:hypothetical protein
VFENRVANLLFSQITAIAILLIALNSVSAVQIQNSGASKALNPPREKATFQWVDSETGKVLFTSMDIKRFDWDQQIFELDREKASYLMSLPQSCNRRFIIRDTKGIIYNGGTFQSGLSSCSLWNEPTIIYQIYSNANHGWLPLYKIEELAYIPSSYGKVLIGPEKFLSQVGPRLKALLETAGVLRSINKAEFQTLEER